MCSLQLVQHYNLMYLATAMFRGKDGQALAEYSLILFLIALVTVAGLGLFGGALLNLYDFIMSQLPKV